MMRVGIVAWICVVVTAPVFADLPNGDFNAGETAWTRWRAPWGSGENWLVTANGPTTPEGTLALDGNSSFGWLQITNVPVGWTCTLKGDWAGNISGAGWAELMLWSTTDPDLANNINRADVGNAADIAFKKDSWGMNPPTAWGWEPAQLSPHPAGNNGTVSSQGLVVVAMKLGGFSPPEWASYDNLVLTCVPEPVTALLLGVPLMLLRRRR